jgi:hypothetical protein
MILWKTWLCGIAAAASAWSAAASGDALEQVGDYLIGTGIYDM